MLTRPFILILSLALLSVLTEDGYAQTTEQTLDEAVQLFQNDQPVAAAERFRTLLTSAEAGRMSRGIIARAYTYLAMTEWTLYRRPEAESAMESALRTDGQIFTEYGRDWAKKNAALTDAVVTKILNNSIALYDDAEYDGAVRELTVVLPIEDVISPLIAAEIHKCLAFCYVAMRKTTLARLEFRAALRLNKQLDLGDDSVIAPKLRRSFIAVRRDVLRQTQSSGRRNTLLRSLVLPGWGQLYRGARWRGYGFMAAEITLLTGTFFSIRSYSQARDAYLGFGIEDAVAIYNQQSSVEDVTRELDARFDRYQSKGKRTNLIIGIAAGIWVANMIDALILTLQKDGVGFATVTDTNNKGLSMSWNPDNRQWDMTYGITW